MDKLELSLLSEALQSKAFVADHGEAFLPRSSAAEALRELARAERIILGFDILELLFSPKHSIMICGQSEYSPHRDLMTKTWGECVALSLSHALNDFQRTTELSNVALSENDTWYAIVSISRGEWRELIEAHPEALHGLINLGVVNPRRQPGS
jgi:hypothetical protein